MYNWFFNWISPHLSYYIIDSIWIHLLCSSFRFILCVFYMIFHQFEREVLQNKLVMRGLVLYTQQITQQPTQFVDWNAFKSQWCVGLIILLWIANIITVMCGLDNFFTVDAKNIITNQSIQHNNQPFVCCQVLPLLFDFCELLCHSK